MIFFYDKFTHLSNRLAGYYLNAFFSIFYYVNDANYCLFYLFMIFKIFCLVPDMSRRFLVKLSSNSLKAYLMYIIDLIDLIFYNFHLTETAFKLIHFFESFNDGQSLMIK